MVAEVTNGINWRLHQLLSIETIHCPRAVRLQPMLALRLARETFSGSNFRKVSKACFLGSNATPFFQIAKASAAIFRDSVRRAISAFIPFSWRWFKYGCQLAPPEVAAEMKTDLRRRLQFVFSPRVATGLFRRTTRP